MISHRGRKERKGTADHGSKDRRVIHSRSAFVIFAISVCKISVRKGDPHGDREERKGTADHGSKGHPIQIGLSDLCDLRV